MNDDDRQAIEKLFARLGEVERSSPQRDREAEAFIGREIGRLPGAPYFMAQTIVVQEAALNAAQARIEELEARPAERPAGGGLFSGLFGDGDAPARSATAMPRVPPRRRSGDAPGLQGGGGGGFLAGAAQTAMGVAGGVLLGNAIAGAFGAGSAEAGEAPLEDPAAGEEATGEAAFGDEGGMDDLDF